MSLSKKRFGITLICHCQLETLIRDCQCQLESFAMWRFLANVTDPNDPKDKQNKAKDRKEEYKEYESKKRSRSYQTAWESEFTWLQYKESECKMYCKICLEAFTTDTRTNKQEFMSNFVIGTDNFKKDVVRNHDKCEIHAFKAKPFV
jgi:hypothetical protein